MEEHRSSDPLARIFEEITRLAEEIEERIAARVKASSKVREEGARTSVL